MSCCDLSWMPVTASNDARAATLIHEATHYLSNTGDFIKDNTILPGNDVTTTNSKMCKNFT